MNFDPLEGFAYTSKINESSSVDGDFFRIKFGLGSRKLIGSLAALGTVILKNLGVMNSVFGYQYLFPPIMISMVGRKVKEPLV